jgi:hypothetical protein
MRETEKRRKVREYNFEDLDPEHVELIRVAERRLAGIRFYSDPPPSATELTNFLDDTKRK